MRRRSNEREVVKAGPDRDRSNWSSNAPEKMSADKDYTEGQPDGLEQVIKNVQLASLIIYCVIFIVGIVGNGLIIYVTGFSMKRTVNSVWFLNLALADFLFTASLIFAILSLSQEHQWQFGRFMCKFYNFVGVVNMFASIFLLAAISLDRCVSVWVVVWAQNKRTVRKAQITCAVIWVTAMVCSIPYATFRETLLDRGKTYCTHVYSEEQNLILTIFRFVVGFLIPFLVILVAYVAIGVRARAGRMQRTRRNRPLRIIFSIVLAFFICWLPFHVWTFIGIKANSNLAEVVHIGGTLSVSLAYLNSCLNPILYVFMCGEFRKKLKKSICFVLESALAEDQLSHVSSRSLSSHFSRISRKSVTAAPLEGKDQDTPLNFEESAVVITERETLSTD